MEPSHRAVRTYSTYDRPNRIVGFLLFLLGLPWLLLLPALVGNGFLSSASFGLLGAEFALAGQHVLAITVLGFASLIIGFCLMSGRGRVAGGLTVMAWVGVGGLAWLAGGEPALLVFALLMLVILLWPWMSPARWSRTH